jgi:RNA polymerase sigma-B factor
MDGEEQAARDRLVIENLAITRRLARRFARSTQEVDDLEQAGALGLIAAADRFDPTRGVRFVTYAEPCVAGEIRHHLRDRADVLRGPRRERTDGAAPPMCVSLDSAPDIAEATCDGDWDATESRIALDRALSRLTERDRRLIEMRFMEDRGQNEIAECLRLSQPHVSRLLAHAIERLRTELDDRPVAASRRSA